MSLGQILGGIVGGIVGFYTGGPYGALYGIFIGAGIGGYIDPNTPDLPTPGAPDPQIQSMSGKIGVGVPDLCGSAKITGHLLAYGNEHHTEITETQESGGKGGGSSSTTYVTGYTYYMTWAVGICTGPVNTLYTIFKNEDVVWEGELNLDDAVNGEETITLDGMGSCTFYFGTDDHVQNSVLEDIIPNPDYNTPYRNFCYAVLDDCIIGEYPRTPTLKFLIRKIPEYSFYYLGEIQTYDCNPMNIIWYLLYEVIGVPESWLDATVFEEVADVLNREHRGLSILLDKQQDALVYLQTVNFHIDNILSYSNEGKFYPKLFRDDYDVDAAPIVDADVIVDNPVFNRKSWNDTINEVKVQYTKLTRTISETYYSNLYATGNNHGNRISEAFLRNDNYPNFTRLNTHQGAKLWKTLSLSTASFGIDSNNQLWSWGLGNSGACGNGTWAVEAVPLSKPVNSDSSIWSFVRADNGVSCAINIYRDMYVCGSNANYNLGIYPNETAKISTLQKVDNHGNPGNWIAGHFNFDFGAGLDVNGKLYAVGGQLSNLPQVGFDGAPRDKRYLTEVPYNNMSYIDLVFTRGGMWGIRGSSEAQELWATGFGGAFGLDTTSAFYRLTQIPKVWQDWAVTLGNESFAGISGGSLWVTGNNSYNQLGLGDDVSAVRVHTIVPYSSHKTWVKVEFPSLGGMIALASDGTLWACGTQEHNNADGTGLPVGVHEYLIQVGTDSNWKYIKSGTTFTYAFKNEIEVYK